MSLRRGRALLAVCTLLAVACAAPPAAETRGDETRRSGFDFMTAATQALQRDDTQNPAMLWVQEGEALWQRTAGEAQRSCAGCHGDARQSMRGVAARYPRFDVQLARPISLGQRIEQCRQRHQQAPPLASDADQSVALETFVAHQSRGMALAPDDDPRLAAFRERGSALFGQRLGQLNLSCAQCHDERAGKHLGGSVIPQGHATGYPIYRLEWQGMGSLQRRLRNCMTGVRAEPFAPGAIEWVELELFLAQRARGLPVETPAVRP
jgi:L-cysteine S-thiosulfotransferase